MSLSDALQAAASKPHHNAGCKLGQIVKQLGKADVKVLQEYLDNPAVKATSIADALVAEGWKVSDNTIARHRRGQCRCDRP